MSLIDEEHVRTVQSRSGSDGLRTRCGSIALPESKNRLRRVAWARDEVQDTTRVDRVHEVAEVGNQDLLAHLRERAVRREG